MFSGIVEYIGVVRAADRTNAAESLRIDAGTLAGSLQPGDSLAVNGVCLTITSVQADELAVGLMPETLRRSNLGELSPGDRVNLERALLPSTRLGGHFMQGHVDGTGHVRSVETDGSALMVRIDAGPEILRYVVEKGFIGVNGASLTVTAVDETAFSISLVDYTQQHLAADIHEVGRTVNLEVDILAKYAEKLMVR